MAHEARAATSRVKLNGLTSRSGSRIYMPISYVSGAIIEFLPSDLEQVIENSGDIQRTLLVEGSKRIC